MEATKATLEEQQHKTQSTSRDTNKAREKQTGQKMKWVWCNPKSWQVEEDQELKGTLAVSLNSNKQVTHFKTNKQKTLKPYKADYLNSSLKTMKVFKEKKTHWKVLKKNP